MDKPNRRFEITIRISADDWDCAKRAIDDLLSHVQDHGRACSSVGGGGDWGHYVDIQEYPEVTHDLFMDRLEKYLAERRALDVERAR